MHAHVQGVQVKKVPSLKEHFFWDTWYTYWPVQLKIVTELNLGNDSKE